MSLQCGVNLVASLQALLVLNIWVLHPNEHINEMSLILIQNYLSKAKQNSRHRQICLVCPSKHQWKCFPSANIIKNILESWIAWVIITETHFMSNVYAVMCFAINLRQFYIKFKSKLLVKIVSMSNRRHIFHYRTYKTSFLFFIIFTEFNKGHSLFDF